VQPQKFGVKSPSNKMQQHANEMHQPTNVVNKHIKTNLLSILF